MCKWGTPVFLFLSASICISASVYVCLLHSSSISSLPCHSVSCLCALSFVLCERRWPYFCSSPLLTVYLSISHLSPIPLFRQLCFFFTSSYHFSLTFLFSHSSPIPPPLPLSFSFKHVLVSLFNQRAVFTMKAVSKSPNHSEAHDNDKPKV